MKLALVTDAWQPQVNGVVTTLVELVREMESLIDYNNAGPCLPKGHPFVDVRPSSYWTSTSVTSAPTEAMFVILGVGPSIFENKEHPFFLWPVRDRRL